MNNKANENNNTENVINELLNFEKDIRNKSEEFNLHVKQIDKILDRRQPNDHILSGLSVFVSSLGVIAERMIEETSRLKDRITKQWYWVTEEKDLETFDLDHTIPLQENNPLRDAVGIDERWIKPNNAKRVDDWIKSRSGLFLPREKPDMEIYEKLKDFIAGQNIGREIYGTGLLNREDWAKMEHVHPLGFLRRRREQNEHLIRLVDWELMSYNRAIGNQLFIDHEIEFEFGFLSIPYAAPIPEGIHRVALLRRKGTDQILEATVQPVPFKFWHPDTNAWLVKIRFFEDASKNLPPSAKPTVK